LCDLGALCDHLRGRERRARVARYHPAKPLEASDHPLRGQVRVAEEEQHHRDRADLPDQGREDRVRAHALSLPFQARIGDLQEQERARETHQQSLGIADPFLLTGTEDHFQVGDPSLRGQDGRGAQHGHGGQRYGVSPAETPLRVEGALDHPSCLPVRMEKRKGPQTPFGGLAARSGAWTRWCSFALGGLPGAVDLKA